MLHGVSNVGLEITDNIMYERALKHLHETAIERYQEAGKEIDNLYKEFYTQRKSVHNFPEISKDQAHEILQGMMHTIGYWEGVKQMCEFTIHMMELTNPEFEDYLREQERVKLYNEQMKEELLRAIKNTNLKKEE